MGILGVVIGTALFKFAVDLLFGRRALHLWLTALVAFSVLWIRPLQWWSAGLQVVPTFVSGMVVLIAYGKLARPQRGVWLIVGSAAMTFGLLLYELPVGILGVLVLLRVLVLHGDLSPMAVLRLLFNERVFARRVRSPRRRLHRLVRGERGSCATGRGAPSCNVRGVLPSCMAGHVGALALRCCRSSRQDSG